MTPPSTTSSIAIAVAQTSSLSLRVTGLGTGVPGLGDKMSRSSIFRSDPLTITAALFFINAQAARHGPAVV